MQSNDNTLLVELFEHGLLELADFGSGMMETAPATIEALIWMTLIVNAIQVALIVPCAGLGLLWAQRSGRVPRWLYSPARKALGRMGGFETYWGIMVDLPISRSGPRPSRRLLSVCLDERGQLLWFSWFISPDCADEIHWPCPVPAVRDFLYY